MAARASEAAAGEPVAWFIADDNGDVYRTTGYEHERDQWRAVGHAVFPLYAAPPAASQQADAEFCEAYAQEWQDTLKEQSDRIKELEAQLTAASGQKLTDEQINAVQWAYECVSRYNYQKGSLCHRWAQTLLAMYRDADSATASDKEGA